MQVTVVAMIRAKEGREEEVEQALLDLIPPTQQESGCLDYVLHRSDSDATLFMFYENWKSKEDLEQHLAKPYLEEFLEKADDFLAEPVDIQLFEKLG